MKHPIKFNDRYFMLIEHVEELRQKNENRCKTNAFAYHFCAGYDEALADVLDKIKELDEARVEEK